MPFVLFTYFFNQIVKLQTRRTHLQKWIADRIPWVYIDDIWIYRSASALNRIGHVSKLKDTQNILSVRTEAVKHLMMQYLLQFIPLKEHLIFGIPIISNILFLFYYLGLVILLFFR